MAVYTLPELPYDYAALAPHISGRIMELHHDRHHAAYVTGANAALEKLQAAREAGAPVALEVFQGEGHGFRLAANIRRRYEAELSFYRQVWKIGGACSEPDGQSEEETFTVKVENLH